MSKDEFIITKPPTSKVEKPYIQEFGADGKEINVFDNKTRGRIISSACFDYIAK
jgi:hypothetical protein